MIPLIVDDIIHPFAHLTHRDIRVTSPLLSSPAQARIIMYVFCTVAFPTSSTPLFTQAAFLGLKVDIEHTTASESRIDQTYSIRTFFAQSTAQPPSFQHDHLPVHFRPREVRLDRGNLLGVTLLLYSRPRAPLIVPSRRTVSPNPSRMDHSSAYGSPRSKGGPQFSSS